MKYTSQEDEARGVNPTHYRYSGVYDAMLNACTIPAEDRQALYRFYLVLRRSVQSYTKIKKFMIKAVLAVKIEYFSNLQLKQNSNQYVWLVKKVKRALDSNHVFKSFQDFLDNQQYSKDGILCYEKIFGRTYNSTS
ncbi:hypothetical protein KUTeg_019303 [Tegillarca granosa]|uniref:Uncharacterized protein n=1 Tax=Tegillarca granosa TaxID=220873 RepID=A0ABQ9EGD2_TEGGR|nr:hypothetical protein KUTeg_019302 [Tegillarca granosa]KAJ8302907.1 hypothetical protein KUTeg_019303 [Tegillarca granosa]